MTTVSSKSVKTCIVSSNVWVNGESANWKSDYYKYKCLTFAEVLQKNIKAVPAKNIGVRTKM